jgi:hypothetical protein
MKLMEYPEGPSTSVKVLRMWAHWKRGEAPLEPRARPSQICE